MDELENKTLDDLRALARAAGLRGYSGLRKKQLIELLQKQKARPSAQEAQQAPAPKKSVKSAVSPKAAAERREPAAEPRIAPSPSSAETEKASTETLAQAEQHIESSKFEMAPPGERITPPPVSSDLHEDIERMPALNEPVLCLLPQKPGVVHAYWLLQSGTPVTQLRLRMGRVDEKTIELVEEIQLPGERGHWYFHIPASDEPGNFFVQLGSYDSGGNFVSAIHRSVARIPSLYASEATDRRWSISEDEFRSMYLRAGGIVRGTRLLWPGSSSSPSK